MQLREYLLRPDWMESARVQALPDHLQLFFLRLGHACDGAARFENDAAILRPALYPRALHKVSERDILSNVVRLRDAGVVKLYTVGVRGFGEVLNFRQRDTKRKVIHPADSSSAAAPELFTIGGAPPIAMPPEIGAELNRRRNPPNPPAEQGGSGALQPDGPKARQHRSVDRLLRTAEKLRERLAEIAAEIAEEMRPGGVSYPVEPKPGTPRAERVAMLRAEALTLEQRQREVRQQVEQAA